jgi:hypothetical protein
MYSGVPFSEEIRDFLLDTARRMKRQRLNRQTFKSDSYEGEIQTQFTPYFIASSLHGILFTARLECEEGKTQVRYLVTPQELKKKSDRKWSPWYKIASRHPRDNAANN